MNFSFVHYGVMNMNTDNPRSAYWFRQRAFVSFATRKNLRRAVEALRGRILRDAMER
jgi:hypothetical protein